MCAGLHRKDRTDLLSPLNLVHRCTRCFCRAAARSDSCGNGRAQVPLRTEVDSRHDLPGADRPWRDLYDLGVGNRPDIWPTADCGYRALQRDQRACRGRQRRCRCGCDDWHNGRRRGDEGGLGTHDRRSSGRRHAHRQCHCRSQCSRRRHRHRAAAHSALGSHA